MKLQALKRGLIAAAGVAALSCSSPPPKTPQAGAPTALSVGQRFTAAASSPLAAADDYRAAAEALRALAPLTFGSFTDENGGAVARDVVLRFGDNLDAGLKVAEMRIFGAGAGGAIAERIELRGVTSFGLAGLSEKVLRRQVGGMLDILPDGPGAAEVEAGLADAAKVSRHDIKIAQIAIDGLRLAAAEGAKPQPAKAGLLAMFAGNEFLHDISFDALLMRDLHGEMDMGGDDAQQSSLFDLGAVSASGFRRGDFDFVEASDVVYNVRAPLVDGASSVNLDYSAAGYEMRGVRLARMLEALRDGALPPASETDIVSLGVWRILGETASIAGAPLYSAAETEVDMQAFHWLAPTRIRARGRDVVYHVDGLMKLVGQPGDVKAASRFAVLSKHRLLPLRIDYDFGYDWAPQTGALSLSVRNNLPALVDWSISFDGASAPFDALVAEAKAAGEGGGMQTAFAAASALRMARFESKIVDKGLLTAGFAAAAELQALETDAPAGTYNPADLRTAAALGMRAGGAGSPFAALAGAVADFIAGGGALTITAAPPKPLTFSELGAGGDPVATLGLSARRDPP